MTCYKGYRKETLCKLGKKIRENGKNIPKGKWRNNPNKEYPHILPLEKGNPKKSQIQALQKYLGVTIDEHLFQSKKAPLHRYIHHINSSQLLCYMTFSKMLNDDRTPKSSLIQLFKALLIDISPKAQCTFEYCDDWCWDEENEPEGTSFDFHIKDEIKEYFFEIKFTEDGLGRAKENKRHEKKIKELYLPKCECLTNKPTIEDFRKFYQLFRNLLRADKKNKTVIFITDEKNPATNKNLDMFKKYSKHLNVKHITWQEICKNWPKGVDKPFQFVCFE